MTYTEDFLKKLKAEVFHNQKARRWCGHGADWPDLDVADQRNQAESDGDPRCHGVGSEVSRCFRYLVLMPFYAVCYFL